MEREQRTGVERSVASSGSHLGGTLTENGLDAWCMLGMGVWRWEELIVEEQKLLSTILTAAREDSRGQFGRNQISSLRRSNARTRIC